MKKRTIIFKMEMKHFNILLLYTYFYKKYSNLISKQKESEWALGHAKLEGTVSTVLKTRDGEAN